MTQEEFDIDFHAYFTSGLDKVRRLHRGNYIHLDLKKQNFVIMTKMNEETGEMELTKDLLLIDFGNTIKKGTKLSNW